jgi:hypothetical protein
MTGCTDMAVGVRFAASKKIPRQAGRDDDYDGDDKWRAIEALAGLLARCRSFREVCFAFGKRDRRSYKMLLTRKNFFLSS